MRKDKDRGAVERRDFLGLATLGTLAGAAAAVARPASAGTPPDRTGQQAGYRETPHVKKAYELSRF